MFWLFVFVTPEKNREILCFNGIRYNLQALHFDNGGACIVMSQQKRIKLIVTNELTCHQLLRVSQQQLGRRRKTSRKMLLLFSPHWCHLSPYTTCTENRGFCARLFHILSIAMTKIKCVAARLRRKYAHTTEYKTSRV